MAGTAGAAGTAVGGAAAGGEAGGEASPEAPEEPSAAMAAVARRTIAGVTIGRISLRTPIPLDSLLNPHAGCHEPAAHRTVWGGRTGRPCPATAAKLWMAQSIEPVHRPDRFEPTGPIVIEARHIAAPSNVDASPP
ncbi:hypothetical protein MPPM_3447 [Methylorubrum populi]|uniref:Uncharacterized protein n=1 Tax=Methylorubrum populi TaxID=223967 RepID=A0A169R8E7_9HYPH|nr:hypothetical protein MPPM_3447 [Methylorubrum populi]